jgi:hypothetical protein
VNSLPTHVRVISDPDEASRARLAAAAEFLDRLDAYTALHANHPLGLYHRFLRRLETERDITQDAR